MRTHSMHQVTLRTLAGLLSAAAVWAGVLAAPPAEAYSSGITGRTNRDGGAGCTTSCHSGTTSGTVSVTISGPTTLSAGQTGYYTVTNNYSANTAGLNSGVDIASGDGTLGPTGNLATSTATELYHFTPNQTNASGDTVFSFSWVMPGAAAVGSGHTLYATGRVWYSGNWAHAPNFGVTTAATFTALLDGVAVPAARVYGQTGTLSTSGGETTGGVSFSSSNTSVCSVSGTTLTAVGVGSCTITATKPATSTSSALSDTFSLTVGKASQTITFPAIAPKLTTSPPFTVSATGGGSTQPVTYTTSGVCTNSGATVTLTGVVGTCTVTANQAGDANYFAASPVSISVSVVAAGEVFPPNCQPLAGWAQDPAFPSQNWSVATDSTSQGSCSFKSDPLPNLASAQYALYAYTGTFQDGTISFSVRVSSFTGSACFLFAIDQTYQNIGSSCTVGVPGLSGILPFQTVNIPITAGSHKIWILYYRANNTSIAGSDAAWLDQFTMPLLTAITSPTSVNGTYGTPLSYQIVADNSPQFYSANSLPPGLTLDASTGLISGTPTAAGTYPVTVTVSNPGGVAPSATDSKIVTFTIAQAAQVISFPAINNKLTTASLFGPPVSGNVSSGIPVVITSATSSVCIAGGVNGTTIQIVGPGVCTLTANQAGDANYSAAAPVVQSFQVSTAASELFPAGCAFPSGWSTTAGATAGWIVDSNTNSSGGACSLRSSTISASQTAKTQFTATFAAGTLDFKVSTSSESYYDCLFVYVDTIKQSPSNGSACALVGTGFSGLNSYTQVSIPITAGSHTIVFSYEKDGSVNAGADAVWIDDLVFPQFTLTVNKTGSTGTGTVFSDPSGIVCGSTCSAALSGSVSLSAFANPGSYLSGWSGGGCSGSGACIVNLAGNTTVTANFALIVPPGAPQSVGSSPGNGQANITFLPPASNGGGAITLYTSTCVGSGQPTRTDNASSSPIIATGLANGVQYSCTVTATNSAGTGTASTATLVTPRTVPDAPVIGTAIAGNAQASVAFAAPTFNGGDNITAYTATCVASGQTTRAASGATSPLNVTSMVNGIAYSCSVTATNGAGTGAASGAVSVTPRTTPGAPVMPSAVPYDSRAIINWAAPASDGGSPITGYTVSCNGGTVIASAASAPLTLGGLVNGTTYTCTVSANNAAGSTPSSSFSFVPLVNAGITLWSGICTACHEMVPAGAHLNAAGPTITALDYARANQPLMMAESRVQALTVAERTAIANYILAQVPTAAEVTPFQTPKLINLATRITIGGVVFESIKTGMTAPAHGSLSAVSGSSITYTPNAGYVGSDTFTVVGSHDSGTAFTGSEITINVTVQAPPQPVITSTLTATGTNGAAFNYQITASNGPTGFDATGLPTGLTVNNITGAISGTPTVGGSFMVTISASNAGGTGSATLAITLNAAGQTITFPAQSPAGRAFVSGGTFAVNPLATASSGLTPTYVSKTGAVCSVTGTTVTTVAAGTCTIGANQSGNVNFAAAVEVTRDVTITPSLPGAPVIGTATPGNNQAVVAFTAPANTGGVAITGYTATCAASGQATRTGTGAVSPIVVSTLTNLVQYSCSVTATNSVGTGPASGTVTVTPDQVPTAPTIVSASSATFTVNAPGSFSIIATGYPTAFTYAVTGTLPTGVALSTTTGVLSGTPSQAGSFPVTFSVTNTGGTGMQSFTLTVNKANQTISFTNPGGKAIGTGTIPLTAVATSGLAVSFVSDTTGVCTVAGSTVTPVNVGTCTIRAQQGGNANFNVAPDVSQSFSITQGTQTITFGAQSSPRAFVSGGTFAISPLGTASSGLGVTHTSLTTGVCSISGTTVTMVGAGTCTIAANQSGNANYAAAAQVTQSVTISGTAPGAPTLNTATGGDTKITLAFTAPASNGGSPITGYTATCGGFSASGSSSPIAVNGLTNGNTYSCSVTATNASTLTSGPSNSLMATANALPGATVWANTCALGGCHGFPPVTFRLNAGGADATVLDYSVAHPTSAMLAMASIVGALTPQQRMDVAQYIRDFIPAVNATTPVNTAVGIDVSSQVFLNTPSVGLTSLQQAGAPANGVLSFPGGAIINYTPNNGFVGIDTFTYRAVGAGVQTDVRSVTVTVTPAAPVITSSLAVSGTISQAFSYQIAASNGPTGYNATGLPAWASVSTTTGVISGIPNAGGTTMVNVSATGAGGTGNATLALTINLALQSITFPAQTTSTRTFAQGGTFPISPTATGGASGNAVVYSSTSAGVCTVSGTTVTMVAAGICTIAANQAGNATYAAAAQVTQNVTITGTAPAAPTIGAATAGNTQATINFTAPANTGGLPITGYAVNCSGIAANGPGSPIVVSGLANGTTYACSVQAFNLAGSSPSSGTVMVTPVAIAFMGNVESRKLHGAAGLFSIPINPATPITGAIAIEPRAIGNGHQIAFEFNNPPSSLTGLTVLDAAMQPVGSASPSFAGNFLVVTLTGIPDGKRVTITATGVNNALTVSASVGFLMGDVNGSRTVTAADIAAIKSLSAQAFVPAKFMYDLDASGTVTASDVTRVKSQAGKVLP